MSGKEGDEKSLLAGTWLVMTPFPPGLKTQPTLPKL